MNEYMNKDIITHYKDDLYQNLTEFNNLMSVALLTIKRATTLHDQLETYYVPNIHFEKIDSYFEKILARIMGV
ncbi:hypothetical protein SDC9_197708 [bioreactor metagenome]|uniref:Uncharacterized protein n=1 Tax=bioreactor metagenome TaxID=1076179 RepID=A0A645IGW2_9ZZZZ